MGFSSLQDVINKNLPFPESLTKPQWADSSQDSEKPLYYGISDEGISQEFIKYLFSCQKPPPLLSCTLELMQSFRDEPAIAAVTKQYHISFLLLNSRDHSL